jgi:transposase
MADKKRTGRPRSVMTPDKELEILTAIRLGLREATAANVCGVQSQTLHSHKQRHPEFADKIATSMAACERKALVAVVERFEDDWRAATWFLERRFPDVWGRREAPPIQAEHEPDPRFD